MNHFRKKEPCFYELWVQFQKDKYQLKLQKLAQLRLKRLEELKSYCFLRM